MNDSSCGFVSFGKVCALEGRNRYTERDTGMRKEIVPQIDTDVRSAFPCGIEKDQIAKFQFVQSDRAAEF
jgi:hypothetical protein